MMIRGTVLSMVRVQLNPERVEVKGDHAREGLSLDDFCTSRLEKSRIVILRGFEDNCRYFNFTVRRRTLDLKPSMHGLTANRVPILEVRRYGFGLTSYRVVMNVLDELEQVARGWRRIARSVRARIDRALGEDGFEVDEHTSHLFSEVYPVVELEPAGYQSYLFNGLSLDEKVLKRLVAPLKKHLAGVKVDRDYVPEEIFISRDGYVLPFPVPTTISRKKSRNLHTYRRRKRRLASLAVDMALALKVFLENPHLWAEEWSLMQGLIFLNPHVLMMFGSQYKESFGKVFWRLYNVLDLDDSYLNYRSSALAPQSIGYKASIVNTASLVLSGRKAEISKILKLDNLTHSILALLILKMEVDTRFELNHLRKRQRIDAYTVVVEEILRLVFKNSECCPVKEVVKKIVERKGHGFSVSELTIMLQCVERTSFQKVKDLVEKLVEIGSLSKAEEKRRGRGKAEVTVYSVVWNNSIVKEVKSEYELKIPILISMIEKRLPKTTIGAY